MQSILTYTLFVCLFMQVQSLITGDATCDDVMYFYADGILKIKDDKWITSSPVTMPDSTKVVGIRCKDNGGIYGIFGIKAALSNGVKTDTTWKCSRKYEPNWNMPGFDDSAWRNAVKLTNQWGTNPSSLNGKADWIWISVWRGKDPEVYCRKDMTIPVPSLITGHAACDDVMYFYADGILKIKDDKWSTSSPVKIPDSTKVVGIRCKDNGGLFGIKVALSNGVKTDTTWKCSPKYEPNWNMPGFDDSAWSNAVKLRNRWGIIPSSLNGKADWIWATMWRGQDAEVYCRNDIKKSVQSVITGLAACDDAMYFYADGILTINDDKWSAMSPVRMPDSTKVIGIRCNDTGGLFGIKAVLSNGVKTDTTWKCSPKYETNWNMPGFDDSAWSNAVRVPTPWGTHPPSFKGEGVWIWTSGWMGQDTVVYCRKDMKKPGS